MKHKIWANHLMGAMFAFVLSVSAVGNLATGYDLKISSMAVLLLWCAGFSLLSALLLRFKHGGAVLLCLAVLAALVLWKGELLWEQLQSLTYTVSSHYHDVYAWPVLGKPVTEAAELPLILLSAWTAVSVNWVYCRQKHILAAMPPVLLPLIICFLTTDREPDAIYLYLIIFGVGLLLITDWSRRNHWQQGTRLARRLATPLAAALLVLFVTNPSEGYVKNAGKYQKAVVSWFQQLQNITESAGSGVSFESAVSHKLNLRNIGPKRNSLRSIMRVNGDVNGTVYLRGRDYDRYSGTGWEASLGRTETFTSGGASVKKLTVTTYGVLEVLYVPYYSTEEITLTDGALDNRENLQLYTYYLSQSTPKGTDTPDPGCTKLPADTLQWASGLDILIEIKNASLSEKVYRIGNYVQETATYDLSTSRMPADHNDFAQWFLEESDTGYCVHFATAATVLLRAAGIPARYVEGYMVTCEAGKNTVVSAKNAHAWAEYYDFASGAWRILEATPAALQEDHTTAHTEPEETEPEDTALPTEPSETEPPATTPPGTDGQTQPSDRDDTHNNTADGPASKELPDWIKTVFWIVLALAFVPVQSHIRIFWKRKQWDRGRSNGKAITRWRQTKEMARIVKVPFPEELELLAQKAKFSQHRIQADELQLFEAYRKTLLETVRSKPWYQRLFLRWIFAIA